MRRSLENVGESSRSHMVYSSVALASGHEGNIGWADKEVEEDSLCTQSKFSFYSHT